MSQLHSAFDSIQFQILYGWVADHIRTQPLASLATLVIVFLLGFSLRHLITSSPYPNIDGPPNKKLMIGHLFDIFSPRGIAFHDNLQDTYGSVCKVNGFLGKEDLYVSDPRFLHEVLVKEVETVFPHPQVLHDFMNISFGPGLLAVSGEQHRMQRKMLNPVFTPKHMKSLNAFKVTTFTAVAQNMKAAIMKDLDGAPLKEIDMLEWCSATALELIGQAGLGHSFGTLHGQESAFIRAAKNYNPAWTPLSPVGPIFQLIYNLRPRAIRRKIAEWIPHQNVQILKEIIDVQDAQARMILTRKQEEVNGQDSSELEEMNDIITVLLKANMKADERDRLPHDQLLGQINTLLFAAYETTSGALARTLQILSQNPDIQDRLRAELQATPEAPTYDELHSLPYLDALCRETLRVFPPVPLMERYAARDWIVPLRYPIKGKDGKDIREIHVKKGTHIYTALRQANRETWGEDADQFRPERWLEKLPDSVSEARTSGVYSSIWSKGVHVGPFAILKAPVLILGLFQWIQILTARAQNYIVHAGQDLQVCPWRKQNFMDYDHDYGAVPGRYGELLGRGQPASHAFEGVTGIKA
ncbi:Cytochrome P450 [Ceratobasidium theobromae]|uniref:Cytochrome P450 n=1 Tax=Ceratobasidium theobromae TaxID=1582974 RepID=A0A5N5Q9C4_9AGAM|nr:Cytochrome P450 [Ceratobasidium theobromae]